MATGRKRSASLRLTTMLAGAASFTLTACGDSGASADWNEPVAGGEPVRAFAYRQLEDCQWAKEVTDAECRAGWAAALADDATHAPRFAEQSACEEQFGAGHCTTRTFGAANYFSPLLAGFVIGQLAGAQGQPYYRGTALYREDEERGGYYASGWGGRLTTDYASGRSVIAREGVEPPRSLRQAPPRVRTPTRIASRGGFGGGRSYGFGG